MLNAREVLCGNVRKFSKYVEKDRTAKAIRQKFLDYFINQHSHNFVKSSPVIPFCDNTVAFVNAGMNQFKGIFIGTHAAPCKKAANSQKCVRVGGKHNDLDAVGSDGYHHTFFEMLGSWSFGDYFKKEACELAWNLLTNEYKIPPTRLYVTYFKGDDQLGLAEDLETKEIWKSIGVPEERLLSFSAKDNFWEMGSTGPCGPCTEIHVDHLSGINRSNLVNRGLHDLTELWNLVFIQYNRKNSESIDLLPEKHVDTGMGFERLTAFLQGKISNYDTDNFTYLLNAIHKNCSNIREYRGHFGEKDWNNLDTSYRILADHVRMVTICLADGMIPEQNQKLRKIMRKAFLLSETVFQKEKGLLKELSNYVIEHLGPVYSELERNSKQIHQIIDYEEDVYKQVRKSASDEWTKLTNSNPKLRTLDVIETPGLISAYKDIQSANPKAINDKFAFKLYDTFGLDETAIEKLAQLLEITFDKEGFNKQLDLAKERSKQQGIFKNRVFDQFLSENVPKTDVSQLYNIEKVDGQYKIDQLSVEILKIVHNAEIVDDIASEMYCSLLLDRSNFYIAAGGQISDKGVILIDKHRFEVLETEKCQEYILHKGFLHASKDYRLKPGVKATLCVDIPLRLKTMRNHTAVHLLNAALKEIKGATCQKSSKVTDSFLNLDVGIFGEKIAMKDVDCVEKEIGGLIKRKLPVNTIQVDSQKLGSMDYVTLIPGEIYPETDIRVVEVKGPDGFLSREPCCGTHVLETSDIEDFCIISVKSLGRSTTSIHAVTGERAKMAKANGFELLSAFERLEQTVHTNPQQMDDVKPEMVNLRNRLQFNVEDSGIVPVLVKYKCADVLNRISKYMRESAKEAFKENVTKEMQIAIATEMCKTKNNQKYMVHFLESNLTDEHSQLQKATRLCPDIPVLVISYADSLVKARCCVPKTLKSDKFDAEKWMMDSVVAVFKGRILPSKTHDGGLVCNMKAKKIDTKEWNRLMEESIKLAKKYIEDRL